jgi:hypothetical protein
MKFGSSSRHYHHQQYLSSSSSSEQLSSSPPPPKFKTAYADIEDKRRRILTFDIEKIDSCCCGINLTTEDFVCIVVSSGGERKYANTLLMRLCVRALISKRQGGFESTNVIFVDAGGGSCSDVYQCVNFARQYGLDIKKVLQSVMISRAFTIYQLADLIIYQLPRIIQQFNDKVIVVVIADLLSLFTLDHNINRNEAISLIKEIINSIRKTLDNILVVVSFQQRQEQHHGHHSHKSYAYDKILLPRFDKHIEIIRNNSSKMDLLDVKVYNDHSKNCSKSLLLQESDLHLIPASPR